MNAGARVGVCVPMGWTASGVAAGIKPDGRPDLCLVATDRPASAAGVFTRNLVRAAPVVISSRHLDAARGFRGVVVSSGNANAATGTQGVDTAQAMCSAAAECLDCTGNEILIAQTGLIGIQLDRDVAVAGVRWAAESLGPERGQEAAQAMLTTDTVQKIAVETFNQSGSEVTVGGMAKGAAMLAPSMATMLAVITTDAAVEAGVLKRVLRSAMQESFHSVLVDGCMSTNDTVFLLANGAAEAELIDSESHHSYPALARGVEVVCASLARQMACDAEGATKLLEVRVTGAASDSDARLAARSVAGSVLVKCSIAGEDAYWGRVLADTGASGADFDPRDCTIRYGGVVVSRGGIAAEHDVEAVAEHMRGREIVISIDLGAGAGAATVWGSDLTHAYLDENMGTS